MDHHRARAAVSEPKILILDESSAALDFDSTERLFTKMRESARPRARPSSSSPTASRNWSAYRTARPFCATDVMSASWRKSRSPSGTCLPLMTGEEARGRHHDHEAPQPRRRDDCDCAPMGCASGPGATPSTSNCAGAKSSASLGLTGRARTSFVRILAGVEPLRWVCRSSPTGMASFHAVRGLPTPSRGKIAYVSGDRKREGFLPRYRSSRTW